MNSKRLIQLAAVALALGVVSARVLADPPGLPSGPLIKISELSTGSFADPNAQYLVLRMAAGTSNGNNLGGYTVVFYQPDFHETSRITLATDANRGTRGAPYLIAKAAAQALYHVQADYLDTIEQPWGTQGYICLYKPGAAIAPNSVQDPSVAKDDCLAYGNVTDANTYINDPSHPNLPFNPAGGVPLGFIARRLYVPGNGSSEHDFALINPNDAWPANNRGVVGSPNATPCGSGILDGAKQCDAGSTANGVLVPGCSANCLIVGDPNNPLCGNGKVDPGEACDDGSTVDLDGCSSTCQWEFPITEPKPVCGNLVLENGESCDAASLPTPTCHVGCDANNPPPPSCGNGTLELGEQCDTQDANCQPVTCAWTAAHTYLCGNKIVEPGEQCDDGNTLVDGNGCSADCTLAYDEFFACQNGVVEPGEQCDGDDAYCNANTCAWSVAVTDPPSSGTSTTGSSTAGPGANTTAGGGVGQVPTGSTGSSTGGASASTTGGTSTGTTTAGTTTAGTTTAGTTTAGTTTAGTSSTTGSAASSSSSSTSTGGSTVIKSTSCAQAGAPGMAWTLSLAAFLWNRRKRVACLLRS